MFLLGLIFKLTRLTLIKKTSFSAKLGSQGPRLDFKYILEIQAVFLVHSLEKKNYKKFKTF